MKGIFVTAASATVLFASAAAANASPLLDIGVDRPGAAAVEKAQYAYSGRNYCWYQGGWRGPGWYWCGYAWRSGWGWGGPAGWRGWDYGPRYWRGGAWIGPRGYRHREWRGWRGDHDRHGGWRDHDRWRR
jgi:hypothetical protein